MRMQTSQAEIVATVLFAADALAKERKDLPSESEVLGEVMQWKQHHRPPLDRGEVAYSIRNLAALRWLNVKPSTDLPLPEDALASV